MAFLNSFGGIIYIGVTDKGAVKGVVNVDKSFKQISDVITDCIEPSPVGLIEPVFIYDEGKTLIKITVKKGLRPLYCIKKHGYSPAGCFLRIGSTCKSMTADEIQRRYIQNLANTDLMISSVGDTGNLSFNTLKNYYYENGYHLEEESFEDNLKLRTVDGHYNKLAELMSDHNMVPIIVVKFLGDDKTAISQRNDALMRIFNNMHISEHTGHGIPVIVRKYGKEAFDITDNYINVIIPFDSEVLKSVGNNVGNNVGNHIGDDQMANEVIALILKNNRISAKKMSDQLGVASRTVERIVSRLKSQGILERVGGTRGYWLIKK